MRRSKRSASTWPNTAKRVTTEHKALVNQTKISSAFAVPVCGLEPGLAQRRVQATSRNKGETKHEHPQGRIRDGQKRRGQNGGREERRYLRPLAPPTPPLS